MFDPWRLKLLGDLASLGTVRAVAQAAHLSPSTVSQQLAVLEREAGARLFERAGRRLRLTAAGEALARRARSILDQMDAARAEAVALDDAGADGSGAAGGPAGRVTLGAFTSAANTFVLSAVLLLRERHPRLRVDIRELDPAESVEALRRGDCDVVVTADQFDGSAPIDPGITHTALASDRIVLVTAAAGARAWDASPVDLADHAGARWSAERPGSWTHGLITRACRRAGFEPDVAAVFASYAPLLAHVEAGLSVTLLPELAVDRRYKVRGHPLRDPLERSITAAVRSTAAARPSVAAVLAALTETAAAVAREERRREAP
ncbi:LysR substrate-binding domain-containing protein [Dactylosporangium darangshiense]|uniref:LysR family transcriptional regulator n=1 Tax=Dactylosporangium darangshiense TaxID=579108 RepID=A0ABP8D2T4_9ACTN